MTLTIYLPDVWLLIAGRQEAALLHWLPLSLYHPLYIAHDIQRQ